MKFPSAPLFAATCLVCAMPVAAQTAPMVEVTSPVANLRSGPGTRHGVVGTVRQGQRLYVLAWVAGWVQVSTEGTPLAPGSAWVSTRLVEALAAPAGEVAPPPPPPDEPVPPPPPPVERDPEEAPQPEPLPPRRREQPSAGMRLGVGVRGIPLGYTSRGYKQRYGFALSLQASMPGRSVQPVVELEAAVGNGIQGIGLLMGVKGSVPRHGAVQLSPSVSIGPQLVHNAFLSLTLMGQAELEASLRLSPSLRVVAGVGARHVRCAVLSCPSSFAGVEESSGLQARVGVLFGR